MWTVGVWMPKHQWKNGVKTICHNTQTKNRDVAAYENASTKQVWISLSRRPRIHTAPSVVGGATMAKTSSNGLLKFGTAVLVLLTNMVAEILVAT